MGRLKQTDFDLSLLANKWPSEIVCRDQETLDRFSGGILNARYLANLDSKGKGPRKRIRVGRKVAYPVDALIEFMKSRQEL